tara:strand:+ start:1864 stop:2382 length:519 start_codon:yes stop_codon:yes gene_type:complete
VLKIFSRFIILSSMLLAGFAIGTAAVFKYETSSFKPWGWAPGDEPIVLNCYGDDFEEIYLDKPLKYWAEKGYNVAFVQQDVPSELCKESFIDGFILLKKRNHNDPYTIALTERRVALGRIRAATIYFNPGSYRLEYVLEHELGHAFGFTHLEEEGHIMHPEYEKMGSSFWMP